MNSEISVIRLRKDDVVFHFYDSEYKVKKSVVKGLLTQLIDLNKSIPTLENGEINWDKIAPGTPFTAQIDGALCVGEIQKEDGEIYLCQNKQNGNECDDKLGYKYSWTIEDGSFNGIAGCGVNFISFRKNSKQTEDNEVQDLNSLCGFDFKIYGGCVKIGCQGISNTKIKELAELIDASTK